MTAVWSIAGLLIVNRRLNGKIQFFVVAGLVPAIHVCFVATPLDVDAQHKAGHDDVGERSAQ